MLFSRLYTWNCRTRRTQSESDEPPEPLPAQSLPSVLSGYATKQGIKRRNWKRRFLVLDTNGFSYYKTCQDKEPINTIPLVDITKAKDVSGIHHAHREHLFELITPNRTFNVQCETKEECSKWVEEINKLVDSTQKTQPHTPKTQLYYQKNPEKPKTTEKERKVTDWPMLNSYKTRGAYKDTMEYRNRYPGKKDHENWDKNYQFYMNKIPSQPDGLKIDRIHEKWFGDYDQLEKHHGYIQWLFPIREKGMNQHAQELQLHEIEKLTKNVSVRERILTSYKMMLDFYGMVLKNEATGEIERSKNWKARFEHLNSSYHNYLPITRILKFLGELDFEHLKANFVKFVLYESIVEQTLTNLFDSCVYYWIEVLRDDKERESVKDYCEELMGKQQSVIGKTENDSDNKCDTNCDADLAQYDKMDLSADTLPTIKDDADEEGTDNTEKRDKKDKVSGTKRKGNLRIVAEMPDSEQKEFQKPDVDESQIQDIGTKVGVDKEEEEEAEEQINREIRDFKMGEKGDGDQENGENDSAEILIGQGGDNENI